MKPILLWLRNDLRLDDHPALRAAIDTGAAVVPVYIHADRDEGDWPAGGASRWWLHHSLQSLARDVERLGGRLILRQGDAIGCLRQLVEETEAQAVYWSRRYEPHAMELEEKVDRLSQEMGFRTTSFKASLLFEPWTVESAKGGPVKVFTSFWKRAIATGAPDDPVPAPDRWPAVPSWPKSAELDELELLPQIDWAEGIRDTWSPGEAGAKRLLDRFLAEPIRAYDEDRNRPDIPGSSRLSPYLHFGEISPRMVWQAVMAKFGTDSTASLPSGAATYLREIGWREFAHHLLNHFEQTPSEPLRPEFEDMPWRSDAAAMKRWQQGMTGYPMVDAGMRELWHTGWVHNRVRMIVASFLTKHLLLPWQAGATWFWDTLVDADLANNTLGWQWTAGCGADAAPYFRIFNPVTQGEKFDPEGDYVRRWIPELSQLDTKWIHKPWSASKEALHKAGIKLGETYPEPMVDHKEARERALAAFATIKK